MIVLPTSQHAHLINTQSPGSSRALKWFVAEDAGAL